MTIKKNIWSLFITILLLSTVFLVGLSISKWNEIYSDYKVENENLVNLITKSTENYFEQLDIVLVLLGKQLLEDDSYKDIEKSKKLLNIMLTMNKSISAYGLIKPNGDFILTSTNVDPKKFSNLIKKEETKATFLQALKTNNLTIGRTYMLPISKKYAIPVRKTIFDKNNNPAFVVSVAIPVENSSLFGENVLKTNSHIIHLFRSDLYRQLYIYKTKEASLEDIYSKPLPSDAYEYIVKEMEKTYNISREEIKDKKMTVSFEFKNKMNDNLYLISAQYMKKYKLWASSYINYDDILNKFINQFLIYISIYLLVLFVLWRLFYYINKSQQSEKKFLKFKASHDSLTKLPNSYYLDKKTNKWFKDKEKFSLIYIDLDNFKYVNDTFGHKTGNSVLKRVSKNIENSINKNDMLIRVSGDEFIVLSQTQDIKSYCDSIIKNINILFEIEDKEFKIGASLGISNCPNDSENLESLISYADIACNNAKKTKNSFAIFTEEIKNKYLKNMQIEKELKSALDDNEIYLVYQPQIYSDGSLYGVETLVRWENKKLGFVGPDKFIGIAESTGLIFKLGEYIIDTSLRQTKQLQTETSSKFHVAINISAKQFMSANFYDNLMEKIRLYDIDPFYITLEITESVIIDNVDYLVYLICMLRSKGFTISLDDFGTGYSSLSILRQLPINELKIDKAFVDDISHDESAQHMIQTIINIGKTLEYDIVLAEGVETQKQLDLLNEYGCDVYQGYYYSKPIKIEEVKKFINKT